MSTDTDPGLVESFVNTEHFAGSSYLASNWLAIGQSQGRGRQDRKHEHAKSVKDIYVHVLEPQLRSWVWRHPLSRWHWRWPKAWMTISGQPMNGGAQLGDQRPGDRLVQSALATASMPGRAFCGAAQGDAAAVKGCYRLIDKPDDSEVTMEAILAPHRARTVQCMRAQRTVLCIQDGSDLN